MPKIHHSTAVVFSIAAWTMSCEGKSQTIPGIQTIPGVESLDPFHELPNVSIQYYDVFGSDEASISASLAKNAPTRPDGSKAMGATGYRTGFRPFRVVSGSICKVTKLKVEVGATVILPKLKDESAVPERLLVRWKSFVAGLRKHEAGHIRIEYKHMREIETALLGSKCDEIQAKFQAASAQIAVFQKAYDRETDDGVTQGAILR